jgi:signal transduction histidine kinase
MVEIGGMPILWHIMNIFGAQGSTEFFLGLGYRGEVIKDFFAQYRYRASDFSVSLGSGEINILRPPEEEWLVHLVDTGHASQTGGRVKRLLNQAGRTMFVTYGDGVCDIDLERLLAFHRDHGKLATITAVRPPARFGELRIKGGEVTSFHEKPQVGEGWINGIHPDDRDGSLQAYWAAFDRREPFRIENRLRRADGQYRWVLHAGAPRLTSDGAFFGYTGSTVDITEHRLATATLSTLSRRLMQAQEEERRRIARELHDDICQRVAALTMQIAQLMHRLPKDDENLRPSVSELSRKSKDLGTDIQALSHRLHSSKLQLLGLPGAAASFCRELAGQHDVTINFSHEDVPAQLSEETGIGLFRVMQEALMNAVKHSGVHEIDVALHANGSALYLDVVDRGVGFTVDDARLYKGLGLLSMRERLSLLGGELFVKSRPGGGTTVTARVPHGPSPSD